MIMQLTRQMRINKVTQFGSTALYYCEGVWWQAGHVVVVGQKKASAPHPLSFHHHGDVIHRHRVMRRHQARDKIRLEQTHLHISSERQIVAFIRGLYQSNQKLCRR